MEWLLLPYMIRKRDVGLLITLSGVPVGIRMQWQSAMEQERISFSEILLTVLMSLSMCFNCLGLSASLHKSGHLSWGFRERDPLKFPAGISWSLWNIPYFTGCFLLFQIFPTSTSHSKMVYSSPNLKTTLKSGAGSKPHDVQEALKKKQVLNAWWLPDSVSSKVL